MFTGSYVINPINNEKVPVYVADYVLASYGTGAVMGVAAHDTRDFQFAKKYEIEIKRVIKGNEGEDDLPFTEYGTLVNSDEFDGLSTDKAKDAITKKLASLTSGNFKTNYKLRDWSVSRQRYWGCPIPIVHCEKCGIVPVETKNLPVELPYDVDWTPTGRSPLSKHDGYMNTPCPKCGEPAKRDPDTLDTFTCSSWYYLRYPDNTNSEEIFNKDFINKMLPVDKYIGGIEHATMHLLYARFITKFLRDQGYVKFDEPFKSLVHQGIILGTDGNKMSKSKGNTVSADEIIEEYGSDALRLYLMFGFNYIDGGPWSKDGLKSIAKFIERVERIVEKQQAITTTVSDYSKSEKELEFVLNHTINEVTKSFEHFSFNTSVARIMELVNGMYAYDKQETKDKTLSLNCVNVLIKLLAPCTPHFAEELWESLGNKTSIFNENYPVVDKAKLVKDEVEIVIQVNSKIASRIMVSTSASREEIETLAKLDEKIKTKLEGKQLVKVVVIPGRLVNLIVK